MNNPFQLEWNDESNYSQIRVTLAGSVLKNCKTRDEAQQFAISESLI